MAAGLGVFLFTASPSGGHLHAPAASWWFAGISALGLALVATVVAFTPMRRGAPPSPARKAATLGVATGISWGFVAAVIKELSSHTGAGFNIFMTWSPYVLVAVGASSILLSTHAFQAGPLAASQPGFTIVDPLVASLLGVFIFQEHLQLVALRRRRRGRPRWPPWWPGSWPSAGASWSRVRPTRTKPDCGPCPPALDVRDAAG